MLYLANFLFKDASTRFMEVLVCADDFPDNDQMKHVINFHYNFYIIQREIKQMINKISTFRESCKETPSLSSTYELFGSFSFDVSLKQINDDISSNEKATFGSVIR